MAAEVFNAPTLEDLRKAIDEAIKIAGPDAVWVGFDDESIYISQNDKCVVRIDPR